MYTLARIPEESDAQRLDFPGEWEPQYLDSKKYRQTARASAFHDKAGSLQVTSFEKRYTEDEEIVFGLEPDELLKFMNKAASMRFTEEGEQCIAFFDF